MVDRVRIGIATPQGMTAANGYFSAASALGYDQEEDAGHIVGLNGVAPGWKHVGC